MPRTAVVMAVLDGELYIEEAIESVLAQSDADFELLIVDDESHDSTPAIIAGYADRDGRVRVFTLERNVGLAAARNVALDGMSADVGRISFLDADDVYHADALEVLSECLSAHPECPAVHGNVRHVDADGAPLPDQASYERWSLDGRKRVLLRYDQPTTFATLALRVPILPGQMMIRRSSLDIVGHFDPTMKQAEDDELYFRLSALGPFAFVDHVTFDYRHHTTNMTLNTAASLAAVSKLHRRLRSSPDLTYGQRQQIQIGHSWKAYAWLCGYLRWTKRALSERDFGRVLKNVVHVSKFAFVFVGRRARAYLPLPASRRRQTSTSSLPSRSRSRK